MKKYRGVLGLNTVKAFTIVLLSLAILSVVFLVVMGSLSATNGVITPSSLSTTVNNESGYVNTTGYTLSATTVPGFASPTISVVINGSSGDVLTTGNYTVSADGVLSNATAYEWFNANVTYSYNYNSELKNDVESVISNSSDGVTNFFGNSTTFFALLGVVVIILIISLVVVVVNRFGSGSGSGKTEAPSL